MNILIWYLVLGIIWGLANVTKMFINYLDAPNELFKAMFKPTILDCAISFTINTIFWPVTFVTTILMKD